MKQSAEHRLSEIFLEQSELIGEGFDGSVNSLRSEFLSSMLLGGIPTAKNERYRHTPLDGLFGEEYECYFVPQSPGSGFQPLPAGDSRVIVLENGFCGTECRAEENGVVYGSLRGAFGRYPQLLNKYYNSIADNGGDTVTALGSAFMQDGAFIYLPSGTCAGFVIDDRCASRDSAQMCFSRVLIVAEDGASASVSHVHRGGGESRFTVVGVRETILGCGAEVNLTDINMLDAGCSVVMNSYMTQMESSRSDFVLCDFGCALSRYNLRTELNGERAAAALSGLYMIGGEEHADIAVNLRHNAPDCRSEQTVRGIAADRAVGVFSGLVYVAPHAQRTDASQLNRNILASETARIYTEPQLEIYADDVKCSHGASVGQLDQEAVYYMRQRGISLAQARRLQLSGFVNDIIDRCRSTELRELLHGLSDAKIEKL